MIHNKDPTNQILIAIMQSFLSPFKPLMREICIPNTKPQFTQFEIVPQTKTIYLVSHTGLSVVPITQFEM